jgi:glycerate 2-kinase
MSVESLRRAAIEVFHAGVDAVSPWEAVRRVIEILPNGAVRVACVEIPDARRIRVIAVGKAACTMARAVVDSVPDVRREELGIAVVTDENAVEVRGLRVLPSGHPVPDARGLAAARSVSEFLEQSAVDDVVIVLISGGGSALLPAPADGITLEDKQCVTRLLLASGAPIAELNAVRKHLSVLKGGGLARLSSPRRVIALIVSDVVGDDLGTIASGLTAPDESTFAEAEEILRKRGVLGEAPTSVRERISRGRSGVIPETPKPGDPCFARVTNRLVATNGVAVDAAIERARALGFEPIVASRALVGEAREAGDRLARSLRRRVPGTAPLALIAGGETTVTVRGTGRGGRNQELALAFAITAESLDLRFAWVALSGGTDGRDGPTDAAGGIVDAGTLGRARRLGVDPLAALLANDSYACLEASGDLLKTGATGTNVADLQIVLAADEAEPE